MSPDHLPRRSLTVFLVVALFCLALAAATGVLLRFGLLYGMPGWAQNYTAVRHAHSHLMYFGWVTLALMALIWEGVARYTGNPLSRQVVWQMGATALAAVLSFPAFWQNGYGLTQIGSAHLPLGAMVSTLNGLTWFWFAGLYWHSTRKLNPRPLPVQLWDWAILVMVLASLGAVGLVGMVIMRSDNAFLQQLFLHQFLDLFAAGWFNLALLGLLWAQVEKHTALPRWLPTMSLALLLAPTFVLGVAPGLLPPHLFWIAAGANALAACLLAVHGVQYVRLAMQGTAPPPSLQWLGLAALGSVIVIAFALLIPGVWEANAAGPLRIFYLHDLLLGWVSTSLILLIAVRGVSRSVWPSLWRGIASLWALGVVVMLLALLLFGLASFFPWPLAMLHLAAWAGVPVALAASLLLVAVASKGHLTTSTN